MSNPAKKTSKNQWLKDFSDVKNTFSSTMPGTNASLPSVNISEDDKCFCVDVVAPGFKKQDFKVNIEDDILTISAETKTKNKEENKNKQYSRREYNHSSFTRSFSVPENVKGDELSASYKDGILRLDIPKQKASLK
ncbi:MAG TPA: Hsp20/alpha crystallin family protein [Agriterribacter sp.]|nr:Hsp20/alpha crystallin family protein [Agriterribacter sp.]